jgi:hypothetical protein
VLAAHGFQDCVSALPFSGKFLTFPVHVLADPRFPLIIRDCAQYAGPDASRARCTSGTTTSSETDTYRMSCGVSRNGAFITA